MKIVIRILFLVQFALICTHGFSQKKFEVVVTRIDSTVSGRSLYWLELSNFSDSILLVEHPNTFTLQEVEPAIPNVLTLMEINNDTACYQLDYDIVDSLSSHSPFGGYSIILPEQKLRFVIQLYPARIPKYLFIRYTFIYNFNYRDYYRYQMKDISLSNQIEIKRVYFE